MMGIRKGSAVAAAATLLVMWAGLAPQASATGTNFTWAGAGSLGTNWSAGANWSGGTAPSATVGTLTFPDLPSCDSTSSPPSTACYNSTDDVAGLSATGLSFTGGPYSFSQDTSNDGLTVGSGGIGVSPSTNTSFGSFENLSMPLSLGAAQTWTLSGSATSGGGSVGLSTSGGITGGTGNNLTVDLSGGASLDLSGTNEVSSFSATGADSSYTGSGDANGGNGAFLNGNVGLSGDLNGTNGKPVDLSYVGASGTGPLGALTSTGSFVEAGNGTSTPAALSTASATFDSASALGLSLTGPSSGTTATAGTDNSELAATGAVALGGAELNIQTDYFNGSPTPACFTPTVGTLYTLVSAQTISGQFSVVNPGTFSGTVPLANGGTVELPPCNGATTSPVALNVNYNTTSTPETVTATVVTATTTAVTSPSRSTTRGAVDYGSTETYGATVTSNSGTGTPTGTVSFAAYPENPPGPTGFSGSIYGSPVSLCSYTLGSATSCSASNAPAGSDLIVATYTPASGSGFGGSAGQVFVPVFYTTSTTASASPTTAGAGQAVTYTATVDNTSTTTTSVPPTGAVTFNVAGEPICTAALFPTQTANQSQASCSSAAAPAGSADAVAANYQPPIDAPFEGSSSSNSPSIDATGTASATTITTSAGTSSPTAGSSVTYRVTVAAASGSGTSPTGSVRVSVGYPGQSVPVCTIPLASGAGSCTSTAAPVLSGSSEPVTAVYSGDSTYAGSYGQTSLTVTGSSDFVVAAANPTSTSYGGSVTYEAAVYGLSNGGTSSTPNPTGTVTFSAGGTSLCTATLGAQTNTSDSTATCSSTSAPSGDDTVVAVYSGDTTYGGGVDYEPLAVTANPTTTSLSASPSPAAYGESIDYSATITSGSGTPNGGTVAFSAGSTVLCPAAPVSGGSASCKTMATPVAATGETVTAVYSGDSAEGFAGSQGSTTVTVAKASTTTAVSASTTSATQGQSVTYTVTVTPQYSGAPTGAVPVSVGSTTVCTVDLVASDNGTGSCPSTSAPVGNAQPVSASYPGDSNFTSSTGTWSSTLTVTQPPPPKASSATSVSVSPTGVAQGQSVTYSATVSGSGGTTPTGSVAFSVGSTSLCTATLSGGSGSCTSAAAPLGTDTVTGAYSGNSNYLSSSGTATLTVVAPPPPAPSGSTSSASGTSTSPSGTATATSGNVSASADGEGSLTVSNYSGNPTTGAVSDGTGAFYDVQVAQGSSFTSLTITICNPGSGQSLDWWNGSSWVPFSEQTTSNGCLVATVTSTTSPTLAQLTGTPVAVSSAPPPSPSSPPPPATTPGAGYWFVASDGGIFSFDAPFYGSMGGRPLDAPIVGIASTPDGKGYWLVASDGGIFSFGDARFFGSMGGKPLDAPIVGMAADPATGGYWLVAKDGGIFTFGDAKFHGSMGGKPLDAPIVGMAPDPATGGYWLVGSDGGIFSFAAPFEGSTGDLKLAAPVEGMASS